MTMAISERKRTCFVIMPFGEKKDLDGKDIDFDDIYRFFFKKAIEDLGIECIRCDEIEEAGSIHEKMFEHIALGQKSRATLLRRCKPSRVHLPHWLYRVGV
jgi:hypothetical protein